MHRDAFCQFLSGGFITDIVVNPPERKLSKRITVYLVIWHIIWSRIELFDKKLPFPNIQDLIVKIDSAYKPTKLCIKT
jgi:hypothetical protein